VLVVAAVTLFLVSAARPRTGNESITGSQPAVASTPVPPAQQRMIADAQRAVQRHPQSVDALLNLGSANLQAGNVSAADSSFLRAMKLDPARPEARTLHATVLGLNGRNDQALALLEQVERDHPRYGRAWLADGLFSSSSRKYARAVAAWERFVALDPRGRLSPQVRRWIVAAKKAEHR
jgi:cytochrome c-type biogenesis protein CcmH/NrfG